MNILLLLVAAILLWIYLLGTNPITSKKPKRRVPDFYQQAHGLKSQIVSAKSLRQLDFIASKYFIELRVNYPKVDREFKKKIFLDLWSLWLNQRMIILYKNKTPLL